MYVVEIKRKESIGEEVVREVEEKVSKLAVKGRKSIRKALVYDGRLDPQVVEDGYFDAIVAAEDLLS